MANKIVVKDEIKTKEYLTPIQYNLMKKLETIGP